MKVEWARMLGITDDELLDYVPIARDASGRCSPRSTTCAARYEEGLAAFGWAGERFAASTGYAKMMYEGMRDHYGIEVENFTVHAYAEEDHGDAADYLLRQVVTSGRCSTGSARRSPTCSPCATPAPALNRWLEEPGALR